MKKYFVYIIIAFFPINLLAQSDYRSLQCDSFILDGLQSNLLLYNMHKQNLTNILSETPIFLPKRGMDLHFSEIIENLDFIKGRFPVKDYVLKAYYWNPNMPKFERRTDGHVILYAQTHVLSNGNYNYLVASNFNNKDLIFISGDLYTTKIWEYFSDKGFGDSNIIDFLMLKSFGYDIKSFKLKKRTHRYIYFTAELLNGDYEVVVFDKSKPDEVNFDKISSRRLW